MTREERGGTTTRREEVGRELREGGEEGEGCSERREKVCRGGDEEGRRSEAGGRVARLAGCSGSKEVEAGVL
eukprot:1372944-Rhodomonas_salina.3